MHPFVGLPHLGTNASTPARRAPRPPVDHRLEDRTRQAGPELLISAWPSHGDPIPPRGRGQPVSAVGDRRRSGRVDRDHVRIRGRMVRGGRQAGSRAVHGLRRVALAVAVGDLLLSAEKKWLSRRRLRVSLRRSRTCTQPREICLTKISNRRECDN